MRKATALVMLICFASGLAAGAPPLRIGLAAGADGLLVAGTWSALAGQFQERTGTTLGITIVADDRAVSGLLADKQVELAVLDALHFIAKPAGLILLGTMASYGADRQRFLLLAAADSIIHRPEDLWRARLVLAGPQDCMSWVYPLAWSVRSGYLPADHAPVLREDSPEGVLRSIALGTADAGFLPEGYMDQRAGSALAARVRVLAATAAYPLAVLVARVDLADERLQLAQALPGITHGGTRLISAAADLPAIMRDLAEVLRVAQP